MQLSVDNITPILMVKNEDYWIGYVLRDLLKVFPKVIMLDTGSTDNTLPIASELADTSSNSELIIIEHHYGNDAAKIGNGRNIMREICPTHWMFLVDGDEIWREDKLLNILTHSVEDNVEVIMVAGWNVQDVDGKLQLRTNDLANRDGLFAPNIRWNALHYPFEGYGLVENYIKKGKGMYLPARECYAWHMRHTLRSSRNWETFFRKDKINFYPYSGPFEDLPEDWLGDVNPIWQNPYLIG